MNPLHPRLQFRRIPVHINQRSSPMKTMIQEKNLIRVNQHGTFRHDRVVEEIAETPNASGPAAHKYPIRRELFALAKLPQAFRVFRRIELEEQDAIN